MRLDNIHVGIDVDGVLADHIPFSCQLIRSRTDADIYPSDITEWNPEIPELDTTFGSVMDEFVAADPSVYMKMPVVDGAREGMQRLQDTGAHVSIVTHRDRAYHSTTQEWLEMNDIPYDSYAEDIDHRVSKHHAGVDVLVDDAPHNLRAVADAGQAGIMMVGAPGLSDIPDHPNVYLAREDIDSIAELARNRALQWKSVPRRIADIHDD